VTLHVSRSPGTESVAASSSCSSTTWTRCTRISWRGASPSTSRRRTSLGQPRDVREDPDGNSIASPESPAHDPANLPPVPPAGTSSDVGSRSGCGAGGPHPRLPDTPSKPHDCRSIEYPRFASSCATGHRACRWRVPAPGVRMPARGRPRQPGASPVRAGRRRRASDATRSVRSTDELPFRPAAWRTSSSSPSSSAVPAALDTPNGVGWCLSRVPRRRRARSPGTGPGGLPFVPFPCGRRWWRTTSHAWDDVPIDLRIRWRTGTRSCSRTPGLQAGRLAHARAERDHLGAVECASAEPRYVFQIDSIEKAGWSWGDQGVAYFGRGTAPGRTEEWSLSWQCY
jgi:hypothetical protein